MTLKPRTIDDLGIDASKQYAKNQREIDRRIIEESKYIGQFGPGAVLTPYIPSEYVEGFTIGAVAIWAGFTIPEEYAVRSSRLYSYQLIPSLGGSQEMQAYFDKLENIEKTVPQTKTDQYEYKTIHSFVQLLVESSRTFELIRARCNQYQRG